ncbi:MAG TPA: hypothetical protein VFM21_07530 [Terriglobia bacterium]|nr:hypothetical protein [Terriglobia bacterium]
MKFIRLVPVVLFTIWPFALMAAQDAGYRQATSGNAVSERSASAISVSKELGSEVVRIQNTTYDVSEDHVPGRPPNDRLIIRKTVQSTQILDEPGVQARTTIEAWPLYGGLGRKPLYSISLEGTDARIVDSALVEVSRGLEEVDWWSIYQLGTGRHLFDTYVPLVRFSLSRETLALRYVGLEVPPDDPGDKRLGDPHVVAVLTYASGDGVIREALLTADNTDRATYLRSYADETREVTLSEVVSTEKPGGPAQKPSLSINVSFSQNYPSPPNTLTAVVPLAADDLDLAHAQLPPGLHIAAWQR